MVFWGAVWSQIVGKLYQFMLSVKKMSSDLFYVSL